MAVRCEECDGICILEDPREVGGAVAACTDCGHRFDVSRGAYPRWLVVTPTGEELVFETIGELKFAIDERSGPPPPPLRPAEPERRGATPLPPRRVLPSVPPASLEGTPRPNQSMVIPLTPSEAAMVAAGRAERERYPTGSERLRSTPPLRTPVPPRLSPLPPPGSLPPEAVVASRSSLPPPTRPVRHADPGSPDLSEAMRFANRVVTQRPPPRAPSLRPEPASDGIGWVLPAALVAVLGAVGYVLYAGDSTPRAEPPPVGASAAPPSAAARLEQIVLDGELALSEGNLEAATEAFAKAGAMTDKSPRVAIDAARLAAIRADIAWLRLRALPSDAVDEIRAARQSLSELTWKAREATEGALAISPNEPAALRVKVDVLRVAGEIEVARGLAPRVIATLGAEPETAYVLAALDLAQPGAVPTSVVDRLHIAALGEGGLGRARALLVYALARNADIAGAQRELRALQGAARPHPVTPTLAAFLAATPSPKGTASPPSTAPPAAAGTDASAEPTAGKGGGSSQELLQKANEAKRGGDLTKARALYVAALSRNPGDSEALAGLGDTAKAEGDRVGAASFYKSSIAVNPNYLPSQVGLADLLWEGGDRVEAQRRYQTVVDKFPPTIVPDRARQRAAR
jgi:tetratricopeptide (TPR) repeat protein